MFFFSIKSEVGSRTSEFFTQPKFGAADVTSWVIFSPSPFVQHMRKMSKWVKIFANFWGELFRNMNETIIII